MNYANRALVVLGLCWCAITSAHATVIQLTDASSLSASDTTLGFIATGIPSSSAVFTAGSNTLTFSGDSSFTPETAGINYSNTAFAVGTPVLAAGTSYGINNPITLSFATGVTEVGFYLEDYNAIPYIDYNVTFTAYNGSTAMGTFTTSGDNPSALSFVGLNASGGDQITSLVISDDAGNCLSFGSLQFAEYSSGGPTTSAPEPTPLALLGIGLLMLAGVRKRKVSTRI